MKYYAAVGDKREIGAVCVIPPVRMLCSYHYFKKKTELVKELVEKHYEIFIDSGAFSAATKGAVINIDEYCVFIKDTGATIYAGLDVIGDAKQTRINNEYMIKEHGLNPIPTFHMGSELKDLELVAAGQYSYIALGGLVFSANIVNHCDRVWHWILSNNPKLRVHGFGLTNLDLMKRYPWYSVDSSSYKSCRRFGRQGILWGEDFEFRTIPEDEYLKILQEMGYKIFDAEGNIIPSNTERYHMYDFHSVQSYKLYASYLGELNKHRKFDFLTAQTTLF